MKLPETEHWINEIIYFRLGEDIIKTTITSIEYSKCTDGYFILYHTAYGEKVTDDIILII